MKTLPVTLTKVINLLQTHDVRAEAEQSAQQHRSPCAPFQQFSRFLLPQSCAGGSRSDQAARVFQEQNQVVAGASGVHLFASSEHRSQAGQGVSQLTG